MGPKKMTAGDWLELLSLGSVAAIGVVALAAVTVNEGLWSGLLLVGAFAVLIFAPTDIGGGDC